MQYKKNRILCERILDIPDSFCVTLTVSKNGTDEQQLAK